MTEAKVIPFPQPSFDGNCPRCRGNDGFLNVGRNHWAVCHRCKTTWRLGSNLYSTWWHDTEDDWRRNHELLKTYTVVEPLILKEDLDRLHPPDPDAGPPDHLFPY